MQDVEFAVLALARDPAEPFELVPAQRVKPLVTGCVLQKYNCISRQLYHAACISCQIVCVAEVYMPYCWVQSRALKDWKMADSSAYTEFLKFTSSPPGLTCWFKSSQRRAGTMPSYLYCCCLHFSNFEIGKHWIVLRLEMPHCNNDNLIDPPPPHTHHHQWPKNSLYFC